MRIYALVCVGMCALAAPGLAQAQNVLEIGVKGMTCSFCVYGLEKNLGKLEGVADVHVSLELGRARIVMATGHSPDLERICKAIVDAGYTPGDVQTPSEAR